MEWLISLDEKLFFFINHSCHFRYLNALMPYWRSMFLWLPFYGFAITYLAINFGKRGYILLLAVALTVGASDTVSSKILKTTIKRPRPCNDEKIAPHVKNLVNCGSGYSFPSSHATNHFALAYFLIQLFFLGKTTWQRRTRYGLMIWAASIAFGQVYVGVHYPLDVFCGGVIGCGIGWLGAFLYRKYARNFEIQTFWNP
jgi:undecaprenyl-diphosphatase